MKQKIQTLLAEMNTGLIDREHALKAALLTVLAAENLVLIGPPGTAKSMVSRRVAQHIQTTSGSQPADDGTGSYFEYLLTKFSTPEEIFGPLSITELKADRFRRNTAGYLPTAQIAFLDEIFKSSSSILNSLLTILNERIFHNGNQPQQVPLRSLISASNELPTGQEELSALYDRFLMRTFVGPVRDDQLHRLFDAPGAAHQPTLQLTAQDFQAVDAAAQQVRMPPEVGEAIRAIWAAHKEAFKEDRREYLSDRRLVKLLKLLRVSAATNHRTEVDLSDAMLLQHCLWNHPDNMDKVREIVIATLQRHSRAVAVDDDASATTTDGVYVVGSDGRQLVQQAHSSLSPPRRTGTQLAVAASLAPTAVSSAFQAPLALMPTLTKTKGFAGSGTVQDPIRIGSAEDLISMDDPDIALAGYHFVQTADIDCAGISRWPSFELKGHYNGNGRTIRNMPPAEQPKPSQRQQRQQQQQQQQPSTWQLEWQQIRTKAANMRSVFSCLQATSSVRHLQLEGCALATEVTDSRIEHCHSIGSFLFGGTGDKTQLFGCQVSGGFLVGWVIHNTQITNCQVTGGGLVGGCADSSHITGCQVIDGQSLVWGQALKTHISDCAVRVKWNPVSSNRYQGLIAATVEDCSVVERCLAAGNVSKSYSGGIAGKCLSSTIRQCAVDSLDVNLNHGSLRKRIAFECSWATLQNNASIDTNPGIDEPNGPDGKTVAAARFNQRFFESSLGWDFDTVWQWDAANNRPALRFGADAHPPASAAPLQDLLTRQVQANIWL